MLKQQHRFFRSVLVASDGAVVILAAILAYFVRYELLGEALPLGFPASEHSYRTHAIPVHATFPFMLLAMLWAGLYRPRRDQHFNGEAAALVKAMAVGVMLTIVFMTLFRNHLFDARHFSAYQFATYFVLASALMLTWRLSFRIGLRLIRARGWNLRHVAIIGTGRLGRVVCHTLSRNSWTGIKPVFFISHAPRASTARRECAGLPVLGGLDDLERILDEEEISGVFIALPGRLISHVGDILARLARHPVDVRVVPDMNPKFLPMNMAAGELEGMPILSVRETPLAGWGLVAKRALDVAGSVAALTAFAIPMIAIAILVRLSGPGPVMFRQERMSLNGQRFNIFKFRTMRHVEPEQLALLDAGKGTEAWTKRDDPRVTRIGRFLRCTSLDELPQLFNVLLGEMSLVGPRPERPELIERFREDWRGYMLRQNVKAGITGWAQVNGLRGNTSLRKRLQYDLFYIRNWSFVFDLRILWMTLFRGFANPNAH